jgi:hypothetical protein
MSSSSPLPRPLNRNRGYINANQRRMQTLRPVGAATPIV